MPNKVLYILMSLTNILLLISLYFAHKSRDFALKSRDDCIQTLKHEMNKLKIKVNN